MLGPWDDLQPDVWSPILDCLGTSLGRSSSVSSAWAGAIRAGEYAAFQPLSYLVADPAPGCVPHQRTGQAEVARLRRANAAVPDWRELAKVATSPSESTACWREVQLDGERPSHRHSMGICGAPAEIDGEAALIFGGNVSRTVAGAWRTSDELLLAKLPQSIGSACSISNLSKSSARERTGAWPASRWGPSFSALSSARYLTGGWSHEGDVSKTWVLRIREADVEWSEVTSSRCPPGRAFHTATVLEDGKRLALMGGLGDGGSRKDLWYFYEDTESWQRVSSHGPSCAGHSAVSIDHQLILFGGVEREAAPIRLFTEDRFSRLISIFDVRKEEWLQNHGIRDGPMPRRNSACVRFGRHMIISGGVDDSSSHLADTWVFDASQRVWRELLSSGTPVLKGHSAIASGFDMYSFGGMKGPGQYASAKMSTNVLSLGLRSDTVHVESAGYSPSRDSGDSSDSDSSEDDNIVELPNGQLVPMRILRALIQARNLDPEA